MIKQKCIKAYSLEELDKQANDLLKGKRAESRQFKVVSIGNSAVFYELITYEEYELKKAG